MLLLDFCKCLLKTLLPLLYSCQGCSDRRVCTAHLEPCYAPNGESKEKGNKNKRQGELQVTHLRLFQ